MIITDDMVENLARKYVRSREDDIVADSDEKWQNDVGHYRDIISEWPEYASLIADAFRDARIAAEHFAALAEIKAEPVAWRYRHNGGKWTVQKNKPEWWKDGTTGFELQPLYASPPGCVNADDLCRSPMIEALTPTNEDWNSCQSIQDRYDLMRRLIRAALNGGNTP